MPRSAYVFAGVVVLVIALLLAFREHRLTNLADRWNDSNCASLFIAQGWLHFPNYLNASEVDWLLEEVAFLSGKEGSSFYSSQAHNSYQEDSDQTLPPDHPRNSLQQSSKNIIDYSELSDDSYLKDIYQRESLKALVKKCAAGPLTGVDDIFLSACPYNAAYYNIYGVGDGLGWHFDRSFFGVNLVLQNPSVGSSFDFHHNTRQKDPDSESHHAIVKGLLDGTGEQELVSVPGMMSGSPVLFAGRNSLHRVTPVEALPPRINAILTYELAPGEKLNEYSLKTFFGRGS